MTDKANVSGSTSESTKSLASKDEAVESLKTSVTQGAHDLTDQAKGMAAGVATQAREAASTRLSGGKERAAQGLGSIASVLRQTSEQLPEDQSGLTKYVTQAADGIDTASSYLQRSSLPDVVRDVESFARREPALFLGGVFVAGLVGGRFLKSSRPRGVGGAGQGASRAMQSESDFARARQPNSTAGNRGRQPTRHAASESSGTASSSSRKEEGNGSQPAEARGGT
jgi:hypothetical protein